MAYEFLLIMFSVLIVSLISFVGILALSLKQSVFNNLLFILVAFATGTLLAAALLDVFPEAFESGKSVGISQASILTYSLIGILVFYSIERFIHWHHHHHREAEHHHHIHHGEENVQHKAFKEVHAFTYLNLMGDAVHNFFDGAIIAGSFLTNIPLGIATTVAIVAHEIPQEFGDFALLIYGGMTKGKALFYNFLSALTAFIGAIGGYFFLNAITGSKPYLLGFAAGGLLYIASTDLIPELHKETGTWKSIIQFLFMLGGIILIFGITRIFE